VWSKHCEPSGRRTHHARLKKSGPIFKKVCLHNECVSCLFSARHNLNIDPKNLNILEDIIIQYTYPRLDAEVSKHRNHLLKAPFCVHPKTGRVCVPLDLESIDKFDPESVPTLGQLLQELDTIGVSMDQDRARETHLGASNNLFKIQVECFNSMPANKRLGKNFLEALY